MSNRNRSPEDTLLCAAQKNNPELIERLIDTENVDVNHPNMVGQTATHVACLWGNLPALEMLIKKGANLMPKNKISGGTPLHSITQSSKKPVVHRIKCALLLLEHGVDPNITDSYDRIAADYVEEDSPDGLPEPDLLEYFPEIRGRSLKQVLLGATPKIELFEFIESGDLSAIQKILSSGTSSSSSSNSSFSNNQKALGVIDTNGNNPVLATLKNILSFFDCFYISEKDNVPRHITEKEEIQVYLEKMIDTLQLFTSHYCNPNIPDRKGAKPIHILLDTLSRSYDETSAVETTLLLEKAAKILLQKYKQVVSPPSTDTGDNISSSGWDGPVCTSIIIPEKTIFLLHDASRRGNTKMVKFMLDTISLNDNNNRELPIIDQEGRQGLTPLHFACRSGKIEAARLLLENGATVDVKDSRGKTPMDAAKVNKKEDVVELLNQYST